MPPRGVTVTRRGVTAAVRGHEAHGTALRAEDTASTSMPPTYDHSFLLTGSITTAYKSLELESRSPFGGSDEPSQLLDTPSLTEAGPRRRRHRRHRRRRIRRRRLRRRRRRDAHSDNGANRRD